MPILASSGSSPPARGTRTTRSRRCSVSTVHPRPRGEHRAWMLFKLGVDGSSPPARGTRSCHPRTTDQYRFIPARAGNTASTSASVMGAPVHPRPRGEHLSQLGFPTRQIGSSPPARGTLSHVPSCCLEPRFIPARAGNTAPFQRLTDDSTVHPRPRGEHSWTWSLSARRFIPARAGNTTTSPCACRTSPVHPRPRGEHGRVRRTLNLVIGSSPPARGTPWHVL